MPVVFNEDIIKEAKKLAKQMLTTGEETSLIKSLGDREIACVSSDESVLLPLLKFTEGGKTFFLGHRKST